MGLYDRDYLRERRTTRFRIRKKLNFRSDWAKVAIVVAALGMIFTLARYSLDQRNLVPFPPTGEVQWYSPEEQPHTASLTIFAPAESNRNYVVRLDDWVSKAPIAMIPIRGGDTATVKVPLGRYRIIMASGTTWQGSVKMFGFAGEIKEAVDPLEFYRTDNQTVGHHIDLRNRLDGNMPTRPAGIF